jgi:hypothetical protein
MIKYKVWDRQTDLYPLVGGKLTPQDVYEKWGWTENPNTVVLITEEGGVLGSIDNLGILKANYNITTEDVQEAIAQIEAIQNTPPQEEPSDTERLAAAIEFQNLLAMEE